MHDEVDDVRAWLAAQVAAYGRLRPHYERYARLLGDVLERAARSLAPLAIVQTRAKAISSFAEKALRKRGKYRDPLHGMTDLCGGRVITRTRSEAEAFGRFLERNFEIDWENSVDAGQRLGPTEFGYRSVHYIVSFRPDVDYGIPVPAALLGPLRRGVDYGVPVPETAYGAPQKAEVQLRTVVEHAYADFQHDLSYKGAFELPAPWLRELAGAAAALEQVDQAFTRIEERLRRYASSYGAYLSREEMHAEMERLQIVLEHVWDASLAARLGKLAIALGDWHRAIAVLEPYVNEEDEDSSHQPVLRELGVALCKKHRDRPESDGYRRGQRYLEIASRPEHADVDATASLAGSWKGLDEDRVRALYRRAMELDPSDPYALGNYLECELAHEASVLEHTRPLIREAIERCRAHLEVGINLPWAFYDLGKFHLFLGEPYESLRDYARAVMTSSAAFMVETSLASLDRLAAAGKELPGQGWARRLLLLGLAANYPSPETTERVRGMASPGAPPIRPPVVIVAGGADPRVAEEIRGYADLLAEAFREFEGTIISGGTTEGVSGLVGDSAEAHPGRIRAIGYLPGGMTEADAAAAGATVDTDARRYRELRRTDGEAFSPLEPLQSWIDLIASGVRPAEVRVLGINGGRIAGVVFRIALALGAKVGVIAESGGEAGRLLADLRWAGPEVLVALPPDPHTVMAFLAAPAAELSEDRCEVLARAIHEEYRRTRAATGSLADRAMSPWEGLPEELKESNRQQARHIAAKLRRIGCDIEAADAGPAEPVSFTPEEVELLARMEHGRWNLERLAAGWRWGERRDADRKTSPYLVGWDALPEEIREYDRRSVRAIPAFLAEVGLRVRRL